MNYEIGSKLVLNDGSICHLLGVSEYKLKVVMDGGESIFTIPKDHVSRIISQTDYRVFEDEFVSILERITGLSRGEMIRLSKIRKREYAEFRFLHILYRFELMLLSNEESAAYYDKDHTTTNYARRKLSEWIHDKRFRMKYAEAIDYILDKSPDALKNEQRIKQV